MERGENMQTRLAPLALAAAASLLGMSAAFAQNEGPIIAPTGPNSSLNVAQFWDGRTADLKAPAAPTA
jgi:hypothetical protein